MKRLFVFSLLLCVAAAPAAASAAAMPLAASQAQRQAILDDEFAINVPPSIGANAVAAAQSRITQLETQVNDNAAPPLGVPVYGGCDSDQSALSYLEDQINTSDLDEQTLYTYRRNVYDLEVNMRQRGCQQ